jgi:hypothetical protein
MYYRQKDGCKIHGDGHGKICLRCVDEALASKEAEIANWKDISGQAHDVAEELQKELAELRSPGPCGKHPKMFYHTHTDSCYGKIPETEGTGEYLRCRLVAGCTLCAELASAEACIEAAAKLADAADTLAWAAEVELDRSNRTREFVYQHREKVRHWIKTVRELLRALGRKVEP